MALDYPFLLFVVGMSIIVSHYGSLLATCWRLAVGQVALGFVMMILAGIVASLLRVGFKVTEWSAALVIPIVVAASIEEVFRFANTLITLGKRSFNKELLVCGGAFGFGMGIAEFSVSILSEEPYASMELVTAVPMLTMIGIGTVYGLKAARAWANKIPPVFGLPLVVFLPAAVFHSFVNVASGVYVFAKPSQGRSNLASILVVVASFVFMQLMAGLSWFGARSSNNDNQ